MTSQRAWQRIALVILVTCAFSLSGLPPLTHVGAESAPLYRSPVERFGVNVNLQYGAITDYDVQRLLGGWYVDYRFTPTPALPRGFRYVQTIRVDADSYPPEAELPKNDRLLAQAVQANPGSIWLIGNEPDTRGQDERLPADYARMYHNLYSFIKTIDPNARIAAGNIVQPTPLRLQWLDMVLAVYQQSYGHSMPVDIWAIHNQILREERDAWGCGIPPGIDAEYGQLYDVYDNANIAIFRQHIVAFRQWMHDRGYQDKPLIISEYGVLMPSEYLGGGDAAYGDQIVIGFMRDSFDYLLSARDEAFGCPADGYHLVQQWAWYSLNDKLIDLETFEGFNGSLYDWRYGYPGVLTPFGLAYADYVSRLVASSAYLPCIANASTYPNRQAPLRERRVGHE